MNILIEKEHEGIKVGDVIEYYSVKDSSREHPFYMICQCELEGYFVFSLTGKKTVMRYYKSIDALLANQKGIKAIYDKNEYALRLEKINK